MAELKFIVSMDSSAFKDGAKDVVAQVKQISNEVKKEGDNIQKEFDNMGAGLGKSLGKYLAAFGGAAMFKELINNVIKVRSEFQKAGVAIETMLGSKSKADALMQQVKQIAASSPLEFSDITRATQQMLSFNIAAEDAPKYIKAIGDVSMGEKDRFNSLSLAFSQMSASGKLMGQDLLQMINAGFNPLAEMSRTTGKSIAQLKDEMSKGAISAEMVQQAFIDATSAGGKFFGMSENAAKTISGQMSMLSDAVNAAFNEVGEKSEGIITGTIEATTTLVKNYEKIVEAVGLLVANYGVYKAAVITVTAVEKAHGIAQAAAAAGTKVLKAAQDALNESMLANPYVAAAVALSALVTAIYKAATATNEFDKAQSRLEDAAADVEAQTANELKRLDELNKKLLECEAGSEEYRKVKDEIIAQYSQYYAGLDAEFQQVGNLARIYDKLTIAIKNSIAARQLQSFVKQQMDYYDQVVSDKLKKAYSTLKETYGDVRGAELYEKFYKMASRKDMSGMTKQDWKDLQNATFWDTRWGKNAKDGLLDVRASVEDLAHDMWDVSRATDKSIADFKEMYQITEDINEAVSEKSEVKITTPATSMLSARKSTLKDSKRLAEEEAEQYDKIFELHEKQMTEDGRKRVDLEIENREAELRAQRESTSKRLKEIELSKDKEIIAITRWYEDLRNTRIENAKKLFEAQKGNEGKKFFESEEYKQAASDAAYSKEETDALRRRMKAAIDAYRNQLDDIAREEKSALRNLLKEYGDYQQQKLAIAEEYADKIKQADRPDVAAQLQLEQERKLRELEQKAFEDTIDWDGVFSSLEGHTKEYLQGLAEQLQKVIKDGALPPDQLAVVQAKLVDINAEITKQGGLFDFIGTKQREHTRLIQEAANAQEALTAAQEEQRRAEEAYEDSKQSVVDFLMGAYGDIAQPLLDAFREFEDEVDAGKASFEDFDSSELLKGFKEGSDEYKQMFNILTALRVNEMKLGQARIKTSKATSEATKASDKARRTTAQSVSDWFDGVTEYITKHGIDKIPELLGNLGLEEAGKRAEKGLSAINNAASAAADFASSNYIGAATKAIQSLFDIGDLFGIGGSSDKNLERDIERLTASNDALRDAVENLTDEMQSGAVAKAPEMYKAIMDDINKSMANTREMMQRSGAAYDSGKLGIFGGTHSSNRRINDEISADQWAEISRITGASVRSAADFWGLTSKQMSDVAKRAPEVYGRIKELADNGYKDAAQFMDDYISYWQQLEEATASYYEKLTSVSQDTITSDFANALKDMDSSASDFADNFEKYLKDAIINALVSNEFEPLIKDWYEKFAKAVESDGIDEAEADALRREWDTITDKGLQRREEMQKMFDWGSTGEGSGAYGAVKSFSQEQGDELNGRLAAIQIGQQRSNESLVSAVTALQSLSVVVTANQGALSEMRNLMLIGNGHLEDIARYTKLTSQNSELLQTIATKIDNL